MTTKKIEMGKKYKTRDDRDVRILCIDGPCAEYPVVGCIKGNDFVHTWDVYGFRHRDWSSHGTDDLIEVKEKVVVHAVLYYSKSNPKRSGGLTYANEESARKSVADYSRHDPNHHYWYERIERDVE